MVRLTAGGPWRRHGPLVEALLEAGLTVYMVPPSMLKAVRTRYGAAGTKSDTGDAFVLADLLRTDHHRLRHLPRTARPRRGFGR